MQQDKLQDERRTSIICARSDVIKGGHQSWAGNRFALITAGKDCQPMNATIRAIVRMGHYIGCTVVYINGGFKGLVEGGDNFQTATWLSTSGIMDQGGTILKSFECPEFLDHRTRVKAAENLIKNGISKIIGIGGDETLSGLHLLHQEWPALLRELDDLQLVSRELLQKHRYLRVVGVICSVEHDVVGTEEAIGMDSALTRIVEATDTITTTASSSNDAFVVEVMGQHSGYLALASGIASDACMIYIPECPPQGDWRKELTNQIKDAIAVGPDAILVLAAEGATDQEGVPIRALDIRDVLTSKLHLNTKITVLGQIQRGGAPTAHDTFLAIRMGTESVLALRDLKDDQLTSCAIGTRGNEIRILDLGRCLEDTHMLKKAIAKKKFAEALELRGELFETFLNSYRTMHYPSPKTVMFTDMSTKKIGVLKIGKSTLGHCCVTKAVVSYYLSKNRNYDVLGIMDGFEGLVNNKVIPLDWATVKDWTAKSNTCLGSSEVIAGDVGFSQVAQAIQELGLSGLILMGSFGAFHSIYQLWQQRDQYREFCIPMVMVPVTILNNIPGTENSIGADSAVNEIVSYCAKLKRVARGRDNSVFIVETLGSMCGYLTVVAGLCAGADAVYIKQHNGMSLDQMLHDAAQLKEKILDSDVHTGLILRSENANENYSTDFVQRLFAEEGKGVFKCCQSYVGYIQMGTLPTPFDRVLGTVQGLRAAAWMVEQVDTATGQDGTVYTTRATSKCVLCNELLAYSFKTVVSLGAEADFQSQLPTHSWWWAKLIALLRMLSQQPEIQQGYEDAYKEPAGVESGLSFDLKFGMSPSLSKQQFV